MLAGKACLRHSNGIHIEAATSNPTRTVSGENSRHLDDRILHQTNCDCGSGDAGSNAGFNECVGEHRAAEKSWRGNNGRRTALAFDEKTVAHFRRAKCCFWDRTTLATLKGLLGKGERALQQDVLDGRQEVVMPSFQDDLHWGQVVGIAGEKP